MGCSDKKCYQSEKCNIMGIIYKLLDVGDIYIELTQFGIKSINKLSFVNFRHTSTVITLISRFSCIVGWVYQLNRLHYTEIKTVLLGALPYTSFLLLLNACCRI